VSPSEADDAVVVNSHRTLRLGLRRRALGHLGGTYDTERKQPAFLPCFPSLLFGFDLAYDRLTVNAFACLLSLIVPSTDLYF
jgi:hypothetical protein